MFGDSVPVIPLSALAAKNRSFVLWAWLMWLWIPLGSPLENGHIGQIFMSLGLIRSRGVNR